MLSFLLRKMWKNKWLMLCLLVGNILIIGVAASTPMYSLATVTGMIHQSMRLAQMEDGVYPAFTQFRYVFNLAQSDPTAEYAEIKNELIPELMDALVVPPERTVQSYTMSNWQFHPVEPRVKIPLRVHVWAIPGMEEHITLVGGRMPSEFTVDGVIELITTDSSLYRNDFAVDELMRGTGAYARIVGLFEIPQESLHFWAMHDLNFAHSLFAHENVIRYQMIPNYHPDFALSTIWSTIHDYSVMLAGNAQRYIDGINYVLERELVQGRWSFYQNYLGRMEEHIERAANFNTVLILLQMPVYALLAFYIYVVSRKILQQEQNDISVLKSRGASRKQILGIYAGQGLVIGLISFPVGVAFGFFLCHLLGASSGFLYLMQRSPLIIQLTVDAFLFGLAAALFSFFAMVLPVIKFSKVGIVEHKRGKSERTKKSLWQRFFIDVACLGAGIFGLYTFNIQQDLAEPLSDFVDPTMFVMSSLFMVGLGLFCLRIFPYIVKLAFFLGRRFMPISLYTAMVRVARSVGEEQFIMIFLVFTMAIGIFSAQTARTINFNNEQEVRYLGGTDLIFKEQWRSNIMSYFRGATEALVFTEPSFGRFTGFEEVDSITRVLTVPYDPPPGTPLPNYSMVAWASVRLPGVSVRQIPTEFMAIEPQSFGETAWFRDDILPVHINYYLNVLSRMPHGALVSSTFRDYGLVIGDRITFYNLIIYRVDPSFPPVMSLNYTPLTIVGFIDRWPTFLPFERRTFPDGNTAILEHNKVIGNLNYFASEWGIMPYTVWARTNTPTIDFFREFVYENNMNPNIIYHDMTRAVNRARLDPMIQGTNGVLTVNFIITMLVCFTGFLLYWILSIRERVLQFGVFRAMGMGLRSIIGVLINEQFLITFTALIIGAVVGELSSRLFVPQIQLTYSNQIIPPHVVMENRDYITLYIVMGAMIILCVSVLISFISRIRIDQALKLGED